MIVYFILVSVAGGMRAWVSRVEPLVGYRLAVRVLNFHGDKKIVGVNLRDISRSLVTTGALSALL